MSNPGQGFPLRMAVLIFTGVALLSSLGHWWWSSRQATAPLPVQSLGPSLPEPKPLTPFTLQDHDGAPFTLESLQGKWSFLFFGYTHCPDVCPTALGDLAQVFAALKETRPTLLESSRGVFVSVDPPRDTLELLKGYVTFFNPGFTGVTGSPEALKRLSQQMGVGYIVQPGGTPDAYEISHTSSLFLVDPRGRLTAVFGQPHRPTEIAAQFVDIRQRYGDLP